ncbi:DMT family transporter [Pseudooceanicola sediminis]|uniref:DMT family transporter n=1 Tax=Pseudooceanicola sediminis TaxID=2211117 RepID=A0A399IWP5_9RHOB|nr:DMT family transporter [Pseudooceanicola sediminis]KAA2311472.1 DMT family transporter [Puniceibacterium sp. HSS470]RII36887.1 DMT family transporter [Pseudooceanicola sediminis]|tara:strand:- start:933 stop:1916 length:984 start_codon:yes stop_codon:yes gene_type:complete
MKTTAPRPDTPAPLLELDKPVLGILLMLGFCVFAPLGDSLAKLVGTVVPVVQLMMLRFALQVLFLVPVVWLGRRPWRASPRVMRLTLLRTLLHMGGILCMFSSLRFLPLADAVAIAFVMPFLMLILGHFVLDEDVGPRRLAACAVGFVGTMLVIQPSFSEVGLPALLPLGVAVFFSLFMLVTRQIAKQVDPIGMQAVSGTMATVILLPLLLVTNAFDVPGLTMVAPDAQTWVLVVCIGGIGTLGHLLMTWSLRYAPASTLAPMQYLEIPFATLIGWAIFRDFPDGLALLGITVTIASGLYIILRERAIARQSPAAPQPHPPAPPPAI